MNNKIKTLLEKTNTQMPSIIHFIWVGGPLPEDYLKNILMVALIAKKSKFVLNVWVDDEKNFDKALQNLTATFYHRTFKQSKEYVSKKYPWLTHEFLNQIKIEIENKTKGPFTEKFITMSEECRKEKIPLDLAVSNENFGINLRNINELYLVMEKDAFYQHDKLNNSQLRLFMRYVREESIGFKNLAAVSDFLRYEILRQEGGVYFDTDSNFTINKDSFFYPINLEFGIKISKFLLNEDGTANDAIAAVPNHPAIEEAIKYSILIYSRLHKRTYKEWGADMFGTFGNEATTTMDAKRFYSNDEKKYHGGARKQITIMSSGPCAISEGLKAHLRDFMHFMDYVYTEIFNNTYYPKTKQERVRLEDYFAELMSGFSKIGNVNYQHKSHLSWLKKPNRSISFDDSDIPSCLFFSKPQSSKDVKEEKDSAIPKAFKIA